MKRVAIAGGGAAIVVAGLLFALISFVTSDSDESALATENLPATSTTTTAPPAAKTLASEADGADGSEPEPQTNVAPVAGIDGWELPELALPERVAPDTASTDASATAGAAESSTSTSTAAPATTAAPAPAGPAPVTISRPSCASNVGAATTRTAPFTGTSASIPAQMPAVVVKVSNNNSSSRAALIGLDQADIVFEERIEASATRFFAVFHSSMPANVGPVRSGRTTDIQITQNLNRPVFGYSGSNQGVARQIKFAADNGILVPYINTDRAPFARDNRYSAPDNLFVDPASLGGCGGGGSPTAIFSYGPATSTRAQPARSVSLSARSPFRFDWNGTSWTRSQSGYAHTTRTGAALDPANVVVLFVPYVPSQIDSSSVDAETIGSGQAWLFRDGTATIGNWRRAKGHEPYTLTDSAGSAVTLKPGQTWVVLAPAGSASWN